MDPDQPRTNYFAGFGSELIIHKSLFESHHKFEQKIAIKSIRKSKSTCGPKVFKNVRKRIERFTSWSFRDNKIQIGISAVPGIELI